jgi:hypothetical protein
MNYNSIIEKKNFTVSILINSFNRICITQINHEWITFDDILKAVYTVTSHDSILLSDSEFYAYAGVLYESILVPCFTIKGPQFCLKEGILGNEKQCLDCILQTIGKYDKIQGAQTFAFQDLQKEIMKYLEINFSVVFSQPSASSSVEVKNEISRKPLPLDNSHFMMKGNHHSMDGFKQNYELHSKATDGRGQVRPVGQSPSLRQPGGGQLEFCWVDPNMNRFLAHVRKSGMDIIFPQILHDKVSSLSCSLLVMVTFILSLSSPSCFCVASFCYCCILGAVLNLYVTEMF